MWDIALKRLWHRPWLSVLSIVGVALVLLLYGIVGGVAVGVFASRLFIPFSQCADKSVLNPPTLVPMIAWHEVGWISGVFAAVLVVAQGALIGAALRRGVFQALRLGDRE